MSRSIPQSPPTHPPTYPQILLTDPHRLVWLLLLIGTMSFPGIASAIRLHWGSGTSAIAFYEATRCTLMVEADSTEGRLPAEWRLLWVSDGCEVRPKPLVPPATCGIAVAEVETLDEPASAADSAAHLTTARFCSNGQEATRSAQYLLDLPAGSAGRVKVVALDPSDPDSSRVVESGEVTFNGGTLGDYPPVVLRARSVHRSLRFEVTAIGSGLLAATSLGIAAPDSSWSLPLAVESRSGQALTGVASVAALLPECEVIIGAATGAVSRVTLPADEEPEGPTALGGRFVENLLTPPPPLVSRTIQPKDFAMVRGYTDQALRGYTIHLFYIRKNMWYSAQQNDLNEKNIGHVWTTDFNSWYGPGGLNQPDTTALIVRPGKFDELHVWAPSIVRTGPIFHMFYTGVRNESGRRNQRIGVATSTDLMTWTPEDGPVLTAPQIGWAEKDPASGGQQLRDPFVMEDPISPGRWLMYFAALDSCEAPCTPRMVVGVAWSTDLREWHAMPDPFVSTQEPTIEGETSVVESPHVFRWNGQWWMPYTVNNDHVYFETSTAADPAETDPAVWTSPVRLLHVIEGEPQELQYWHATEHMKTHSGEYMGAWNDGDVCIDIFGVFPPIVNPAEDSLLLYTPPITGVRDPVGAPGEVRLAVTRVRWGQPEVGLRVELPVRMPARLTVHDIAGRRLTTLLDRELPAGRTDVTCALAVRGASDSGAASTSCVWRARVG